MVSGTEGSMRGFSSLYGVLLRVLVLGVRGADEDLLPARGVASAIRAGVNIGIGAAAAPWSKGSPTASKSCKNCSFIRGCCILGLCKNVNVAA